MVSLFGCRVVPVGVEKEGAVVLYAVYKVENASLFGVGRQKGKSIQ